MKLSASASSARSALFLFGIVSTGLADECSSVGNAQFHFIYGTPNLSVLCPSPISRLTCTLIDLSNGLMESHDHLPDTINVSIDGNSKNCEVTGPKTTIFSCTCKTLSFIAQDRLVDLQGVTKEKKGDAVKMKGVVEKEKEAEEAEANEVGEVVKENSEEKEKKSDSLAAVILKVMLWLCSAVLPWASGQIKSPVLSFLRNVVWGIFGGLCRGLR